MELPQIGQQCAELACKQLSFLPLKCKCEKSFCSEHFGMHTEVCPSTLHNVAKEERRVENKYCSIPDCKATNIFILCEKCNKHFCVTHRHIVECHSKDPLALVLEKDKIEAPVKQFIEAKQIVDKQLDENLIKAKKGKSAEMANKIQLMRIKNKAVGLKSIPTSDRVYFNIQLLSENSERILPVFVSKTWTVGKTIDAVAQECKIPNNNNQSGALKLRLFKEVTGSIISNNMGDKLETLLKRKVIFDGETFKLHYVKDDYLQLKA